MDQAADAALIKRVRELLKEEEPMVEVEVELPVTGSISMTLNQSQAVGQKGGKPADSETASAMASYKALALKAALKERTAATQTDPQGSETSSDQPIAVTKRFQRVIVIISSDYGFSQVMGAARSKGWGVVVVCTKDCATKFSPHVDAWIDWGEIY
jgi:hypothetical protein